MQRKLLLFFIITSMTINNATSKVHKTNRIKKEPISTDIKIGAIFPTTGIFGEFGKECMNGLNLALEEINQEGGIKIKNSKQKGLKRNIQLITVDDKSDPVEAMNETRKLAMDSEVLAIIGPFSSSSLQASMTVSEQYQIMLFTPTVTVEDAIQKNEYASRICFSDPAQGKAMARFSVEELKVKRGAILVDKTSNYSKGLAESYRESIKALGGDIVLEIEYSPNESSFLIQLDQVQKTKPDILYIPGYYMEAASILNQISKKQGWTIPVVGGDGWNSPKFFSIAGKNAVGKYFTTHFASDDPEAHVQSFVKKYFLRYNSNPSAYAALSYDALKLMGQSIASLESITRDSLRNEINKTKGFVGVTGVTQIDENRKVSKPAIIVMTTDNGYKFVKKVMP